MEETAAQSAESLELTPDERRVLGVLIEKGLATPEYYPMTLKALIAGCNQKSNRDPISDLSESDVESALELLRSKGLATKVISTAGRSMRHRQDLGRLLELRGVEIAVVGELLLRGPQSEGELRSRASFRAHRGWDPGVEVVASSAGAT